MKNHIAVKFIAIVLCAAALLGAVVCGAGVTVLTGFGLYDRTVDEVYQEKLNERGRWFAENAAKRYADVVLGGCSADYLDQINGVSQYFIPWYATYEIFDAQGTPLSMEEPLVRRLEWPQSGPAKEGAVTYTFQAPAGKYRYIVSAIAESQKETEPGYTMGEPADSAEPQQPTQETIELQAPAEEEAGIAALSDEEALPAEETAAPTEETAAPTEDAEEADEEPVENTDEAPEAEQEDSGEAEESGDDEEPAEDTADAEAAPDHEESAQESDDGIAAEKTGETSAEETVPPTEAPTVPAETEPSLFLEPVPEPVLVNGKPLSEYQVYTDRYFDSQLNEHVTVTYVLLDRPAYTVKVHLQPGAMDEDVYFPMLRVLRANRNLLLPGLAVSLLLFAALAVYLCCAAGRKPKSEEVRAGGLNRLPLELYAGVVALAVGAIVLYLAEGGVSYLLRQSTSVAIAATAGLGYLACLTFVGFCFAAAAQVKTPGWFWLKNSLCGWCLRLAAFLWHLLLKCIVWLANGLEKKVFPFLGRCLKKLWHGIKGGCMKVFDWLHRFLSLLPLTWQWLVVCLILLLLFLIAIASRSAFLLILTIFISIAAIIYGSQAFGTLMETARRMSKGDLHARPEDKLLIGCFRDFARTLNALASVAMVAAQKQLKSERMKTELITNVSHDIKTPLTSIISYADLLQKPHTPEEEAQYLEVLSRQSMQLKKLIEDLIEMSKASTGNMTVDITQVDAVEAVNQALGEFADKLDAAMLTPVFRHSDETAPMMADGKLVWRVLHNLLSNAVKYALPGTRLYIDMLCLEGKVILSMKNVSRDELNVDADELMERFVRGDGSRNTEGSGLGLNIAKSMMELQHGSLQLLVDGDLFKVTLIFPGA